MFTHPTRAAAVCLLCATVVVGGCSARSTQQVAGGVGALAGGILGAVLGDRSGIGAAGGAAVGAMAGFIAGSLVGQLLDDADRAAQESASQRSLSQGETIRWNSDKNKGVHGYSETVSEVTAPSKRGGAANGQGAGGCRTVREVAYVDGKEYVEMTEYCRADGAAGWTRKTA